MIADLRACTDSDNKRLSVSATGTLGKFGRVEFIKVTIQAWENCRDLHRFFIRSLGAAPREPLLIHRSLLDWRWFIDDVQDVGSYVVCKFLHVRSPNFRWGTTIASESPSIHRSSPRYKFSGVSFVPLLLGLKGNNFMNGTHEGI